VATIPVDRVTAGSIPDDDNIINDIGRATRITMVTREDHRVLLHCFQLTRIAAYRAKSRIIW